MKSCATAVTLPRDAKPGSSRRRRGTGRRWPGFPGTLQREPGQASHARCRRLPLGPWRCRNDEPPASPVNGPHLLSVLVEDSVAPATRQH
jgi:hypothetical protein